jgi:predicted ATPase/DNA-binding SARP family transcriptional activator
VLSSAVHATVKIGLGANGFGGSPVTPVIPYLGMSRSIVASVEFHLLGPLEVLDESGQQLEVRGKALRKLLCSLAVRANETVSVDHLLEVLWRESQPKNPRGALQVLVSRLRKLLGPALVTHGPGYVLRVSPNELDVTVFERLVHEGSQAAAAGMHELARERLRTGLALWRAGGMAELDDLGGGNPLARWEEVRRVSQERLAESELALGRHAQLVAELELLVEAEPFREHRWGLLMVALYRSGRQAEALSTFKRLQRVLGEGLGIQPGEELQELEERILLQDSQLGWKPVSTVQKQGLPAQLTSFVGRNQELDEVADLLQKVRLLSIVGTGGVGKTRLSLKAAEMVEANFRDGVRFVPLVAHVDPDLVPHAVARAIGIPEDAQSSTQEALRAHLLDSEVLLLLDNCEHLTTSVADLVVDLVTTCPHLRVLTTSRRPLAAQGEVTYELRPLDADEAAVRLFVDRADMARPGSALGADESVIRHICTKLDGLPLAIELAASRARIMDLEHIDSWLNRQFELLTGGSGLAVPHHTTLRATFDWSYDLLADDEKRVLRRLSVCRGGITPNDAEELLVGMNAPLESLLQLADQSLIQMREGRFDMLETVREYARHRLRAAGEEEDAQAAHATLYAGVAEQADEQILGESQMDSLRTLDNEHDNIRAALQWSFGCDRAKAARIAASMGQFWFMRGYLDEGRSWLRRALLVELDGALEVRLSIELSQLDWFQFELDEAHRLSQRAQLLARSLGERTLLGMALDLGARVAVGRHRYEPARKMLISAIDCLEESPARAWFADCHHWLGHVSRYEGRVADALANHSRAKELFLACGDLRGATYATGAQGRDLLLIGDIEKATSTFRDSIALAKQLEDRYHVAMGSVILASVLSFHSDHDEAAREEAIDLYRNGLPAVLEVRDLGALAEVLEGTVPLLVYLKQEVDAARVWGAVLSSHGEFAVPEVLRADRARVTQLLKEAVGPDYQDHVESGRGLDITEATRLILQLLDDSSARSGQSACSSPAFTSRSR